MFPYANNKILQKKLGRVCHPTMDKNSAELRKEAKLLNKALRNHLKVMLCQLCGQQSYSCNDESLDHQ